MSPSRCPSREELERLLDEQLDPADLRQISEHVAGCAACQKALESLTTDPGPDLPSGAGWKPGDAPPHPNFLDRMKEEPPAAGPRRRSIRPWEVDGAGPPPDGTVLFAADGAADIIPQLDDDEIPALLGTSRQALLVARVGLLASQGRLGDAAKAADLVDAIEPKDAAEWYSLARACAAEAGGVAAGKDGAQCTPEERDLRRRLADRAIAALGGAVEAGFKDAVAIQTEPDLTSLHGRPGFRAVLKRLEKIN